MQPCHSTLPSRPPPWAPSGEEAEQVGRIVRAPPPLYDGVGGDADYVRADQDLALRLRELRLPVVAAPPAVASPWGGACESKAPLAGALSLTMHQVCAVERMRSEAKTARLAA